MKHSAVVVEAVAKSGVWRTVVNNFPWQERSSEDVVDVVGDEICTGGVGVVVDVDDAERWCGTGVMRGFTARWRGRFDANVDVAPLFFVRAEINSFIFCRAALKPRESCDPSGVGSSR